MTVEQADAGSVLSSAEDERLVARTRAGQERAFEQIVHRYRSQLLGFCRRMLGGSTEDAEDVLQEVFANAYRALLADEREIQLRAWLYQIARNRCLNHLRRRRPQSAGPDALEMIPCGDATTTHERAGNRDELRLLINDVQSLPEGQRRALMLREIDDLSYKEAAGAMGTTVAAIRSLLIRARTSLAEASHERAIGAFAPFALLGRAKAALVAKLGLGGASSGSSTAAEATAAAGGSSVSLGSGAGFAAGSAGAGLIVKTAAVLTAAAVTAGTVGLSQDGGGVRDHAGFEAEAPVARQIAVGPAPVQAKPATGPKESASAPASDAATDPASEDSAGTPAEASGADGSARTLTAGGNPGGRPAPKPTPNAGAPSDTASMVQITYPSVDSTSSSDSPGDGDASSSDTQP